MPQTWGTRPMPHAQTFRALATSSRRILDCRAAIPNSPSHLVAMLPFSTAKHLSKQLQSCVSCFHVSKGRKGFFCPSEKAK